jgi:hypothetical protein
MATNSPMASPRYGGGVPSGEDQQLQYAVELSLQDNRLQTNGVRSITRNATDRTDQLVLNLNNQFAALDDPLGDTVIYIGPPPMMQGQNPKDYFQICQHFDRVYIVQSANLKLMGENSKFIKMLGPMSVRAERRIRKTQLLVIPEAQRGEKFKYYIDLHPPTEGDEAVILLTDLTCTKGVLTWHLAREKYQLSRLAVLGHDEFNTIPAPILLPLENRTNFAGSDAGVRPERGLPHSAVDQNQATKDSRPATTSMPENIGPEYSVLRHCSAIERLLHAIQGNDPKLDSAPKVWTFFAVARYFGCAHHERVSGWITTWIYAGNNANFIQCNPEVTYRIGMGIESPELVRDAFSILVGERALLETYGEYNPRILNPLVATVHGRKLEMLDDDERNRIDHAASSLVRRIRRLVCMLCRDMDWLQESAEYQKLEKLVGRTESETQTINAARDLVREYVRSRIYYVLCQDQDGPMHGIHELEQDTSSTASFRPGTSERFNVTYNSLNQPMRMFTKTFWTVLSRTLFDVGMQNTSSEGTVGDPKSTRYIQALKELYISDPLNGIRTISRAYLDVKIAAVNHILNSREFSVKEKGHTMGGAMRFGSDPSRSTEHNRRPRQDIKGDFRGTLPPGSKTLNPEAINFSSLAIGGNSKHGSDEAGPSSQGPHSPSKRRKTIDAEDTSQAIPVSTSRRSSRETSTDDGWPTESTENLLPRQPTDAGATQQSLLALPIRERRSSVVNVVQDYMKRHLGSPKADDQNRSATGGKQASSKSTDEGQKTPVTRPGLDFSAFSSKRSDDNSDAQPRTVVDDGVDTLPTGTTHPVHKGDEENTFDPEYNELQQGGYPTYTRVGSATLLNSVNHIITKICLSVLHPAHLFHPSGQLPTGLFDCLLCLDDNEFKYLPLWAGGNDDGTGGVYDDHVPNLDDASQSVESFAPGRIHKPYDAPSDSDAGTTSAFEYIGSSQAMSTVGRASKCATDGTQTIVSLSSASDAASETTSVVHVADTATVVAMNDDADDNESYQYHHSVPNTGGDDFEDADTDMEVEAPDRSDDEFDYDSDGDEAFDDHETLNGENELSDDDVFAALSEHINVNVGVDAVGEPNTFDNQHGLDPELATAGVPSNGKGKEKEILPVEDNDNDDDFELI